MTMRTGCLLLLWAGVWAGASDRVLPLTGLGRPLKPGELEIVWRAPTNTVPPALWSYRVVPSEFSAAAVSNLIALGEFTPGDRKTLAVAPFNHPSAVCFAKASGKRTLGIYPNLGFVSYNDVEAEDMRSPSGVPDEGSALRLAIENLGDLGIHASELAVKPGTAAPRVTWTVKTAVVQDQARGVWVTNLEARGLSLTRSVEGIDFIGNGWRGGCVIDFGNHGRVSQMRVLWRKLERYAKSAPAEPGTLARWVREGRAVWLPVGGGQEDVEWRSVTKLVVTNLTAVYFGEDASTPQNWVYPLAKLEAVATAGKRTMPVVLHCPIVADEGNDRP